MPNKNDKMKHCDFCGKPENKVTRLLSSQGHFICDECVDLCYEMIQSDLPSGSDKKKMSYIDPDILSSILNDNSDFYDDDDDRYGKIEASNSIQNEEFEIKKPMEIKAILDQYIVGQDQAKKVLSVAVYNHYKRINKIPKTKGRKAKSTALSDGVELQKSNVLLLGPTGVGKTLLAQTLAKILNVPFAIADATTLTEAGYVGDDVENILVRLIQAADYDIEAAERGIIYIDEIDKIARKSESTSITRDVSGEGVQQALLKIIEGSVSTAPPNGGRKHPMQENITIDTTNILFICGGAFDGIEKIINARTDSSTLGFGGKITSKAKEEKNVIQKVIPHDLVKFGLIPELVGRLPVVTALQELDEDMLTKILTEPKNALTKQYREIFALDGVELDFTDDAYIAISKKAIERKTGARGLRGILEETLTDLMYEIPSRENVAKVIIDADVVNGTAEPKLTLKKAKKEAPIAN